MKKLITSLCAIALLSVTAFGAASTPTASPPNRPAAVKPAPRKPQEVNAPVSRQEFNALKAEVARLKAKLDRQSAKPAVVPKKPLPANSPSARKPPVGPR